MYLLQEIGVFLCKLFVLLRVEEDHLRKNIAIALLLLSLKHSFSISSEGFIENMCIYLENI